MKRILIRGGVNPLKPLTTNQILVHNKIGGNSGNILYLMGVLRSLYTKDTDIDMDGYAGEGGRYTQEDIERINKEYDAYVIPLADAFRPDYRKNLANLTDLVNRLTIPCHVLSVGIRASYNPSFENGFLFDEEVKAFVKAILNKSPLLGVRGELTGAYLKKLGFQEGKDFIVIGCPSMYIFGKRLSKRPLFLDKDSCISINYNPSISHINAEIRKHAENFGKWYYVAQNIEELKCIWLGLSNISMTNKDYMTDNSEKAYAGNHVNGFVTAGDWIRYMNKVDLSIGGKLHGNIAAILGGAPAVFIPSDARMQELVAYHSLPSIAAKDWKQCNSLEEIVERVNFDSYLQKHMTNFKNYVSFLETLGLDNVYSKQDELNDELLVYSRPITSALMCDKNQLIQRWSEYHLARERKLMQAKKK